MQPNRAVVFDLDDTLYPHRRFRASGLAAVAARLEAVAGLDARLAITALLGATRGVSAGREIETCLDRYELPLALAAELHEVFEHHTPRLRRSPAVTRAMVGLRAMGWRVGVLTNGRPSVQARKVAALGLEPFIDVVVHATTSSIVGKPHPDAFAAVARALATPAAEVVVVGSDETRDVRGALASGMHAIRCDVWTKSHAPSAAAARLVRFGDLPAVVRNVMRAGSVRHAA